MIRLSNNTAQETIVVVGNGMVGYKFCERLLSYDTEQNYKLIVFGDEPRPAYDRVQLSAYFSGKTPEDLLLADANWYSDNDIDLHLGERVTTIDRDAKTITSDKGETLSYDKLILCTGSYPFVPPIPGNDKLGVFVYRTIEDLQEMEAYGRNARTAAVIGGGLLGLEAAKACVDMGLDTSVVEFAPRLMPRQLDEEGARILSRKVEDLGVNVACSRATKQVLGNGKAEGLLFSDDESLQADMIVVSAGIRPRDELAKDCGIEVGPRGGIVANDTMQTSDPNIFVIGEAALHNGMIYGLVAPGYDMADVVAANLCGDSKTFTGADMSTKLKLLGVDVASLGEPVDLDSDAQVVSMVDSRRGIYKKLVLNKEGDKVIGSILVGDATEYGTLLPLVRSGKTIPCEPEQLILPAGDGPAINGLDAMDDADQICSCNNVTKGDVCKAISEEGLDSVSAVKTCTGAGTGCGGCLPLVTDLFKAEIEKAGGTVNNHLCEHFDYSRAELFEIVKITKAQTFEDILTSHGRGHGCEVCKPTIGSILASLWNDVIVNHDTIQDTNDRFLANIQRQGLYSIVPRIPAGEITPDKLIVLGQVAKKYNLYTKITGGQRVDLFGAHVSELPDIWEELVDAGFESGHAYGKSVRTVKSCVGTTWCRFGVQDSVQFALRVEERYKGIRSPHKLKSAVSGCTRECAEAQSKDFGFIATDKGWNLYVCGNGGTKPRHADLLASDLDDDTAIKYVDRMLMYYIHTADKLTRTSVWLEKLEGGLEHLKDVVINDSLGICDQLESDMQRLVDSFQCEWTAVVKDPEKRAKFKHFANAMPEKDTSITFITERDQMRIADWKKGGHEGNADAKGYTWTENWIKVAKVTDFPKEGGVTVKHGRHQIAVYNFTSRGEWYACQNMCPHMQDMVLARGLTGDEKGEPKVACPLHKKTFSLKTGDGINDPQYRVQTFPVRVREGAVYLNLPPVDVMDTMGLCAKNKSTCTH